MNLKKATGLLFLAVLLLGGCAKDNQSASNPYQRAYPMPHQYWQANDEFYVFTSGGQQGGLYVYSIPSMKFLQEIPIFEPTAATGWTTANPEVKKMLTNPRTGEVLLHGDTHHPAISKTDGVYDGRWLFINDKTNARVARVDLSIFKPVEVLWVPNVTGGMHGAHVGPNTDLLIANIELEQYPVKKIRDYLKVPIDKMKGPYVSCLAGLDIADDGSMSNAFQVWGPWQFDMVRVGWGEMDGWLVNTAYNTERSTNVVGMFERPEDYLFFWNIESIRQAVKDGKYITTKEAPDVPVVAWRDVEVYAIPCPLNPHGVDISPTGTYALSSGKATTLVRAYDFRKVKQAIAQKRFSGEEFGVKIIDKTFVSVDIDAGLGPTHIEYDNKGFAYVGFFVDSDVKKITLGDPYTEKHGMEPWQVVDVIPAHYSVGHLLVPGGDTASPYGKYLVIMNKLTKDTFLPHGPMIAENHELFSIEEMPALMIDQMPIPPEPHYSQAIPVDLLKPMITTVYSQAGDFGQPGVEYDYKHKEVRVKMSAVRSFFTPDWFTVPSGWNVKMEIANVEEALDITHGIAFTGGHDVMESLDPGEIKTLELKADHEGVYWYYCLWFCSELHMEMRGRMIVIPANRWDKSKEWQPA